MADLETRTAAAPADSSTLPGLFVSLTAFAPDTLDALLANIAAAFPGESVMVAIPQGTHPAESTVAPSSIELVTYTVAAPSAVSWVLTAADYVNTFRLAQERQATTCLILGAEAHTLHPQAIRELALAASRADLALACYDLSSREGLVNSALLYPLTRAVFGIPARFPLAIDMGVSLRMAERLAMTAQRFTATNQNDALVWPGAEAAMANYATTEVEVGHRTLPQPNLPDLNSLLAQITSSLFNDIEMKATYWQRARGVHPRQVVAEAASHDGLPDVQPMLDSFRLAYSNLHEIWSLVLPPNSLLGLKKLSLMPPAGFRMPDSLWARIVYDFVLAYRLRTLNRGHLLGALTPLYLAWVASHILLVQSGISSEQHIEEQAAAFEADKPYLVSRWRWPDRFNP